MVRTLESELSVVRASMVTMGESRIWLWAFWLVKKSLVSNWLYSSFASIWKKLTTFNLYKVYVVLWKKKKEIPLKFCQPTVMNLCWYFTIYPLRLWIFECVCAWETQRERERWIIRTVLKPILNCDYPAVIQPSLNRGLPLWKISIVL